MLSAHAFDSKIRKMLNDFTDWLNVRDYDSAAEEATSKIVKKQSRGSVSAQNGWYMTRTSLDTSSKAADTHIKNLRKSLKKAS